MGWQLLLDWAIETGNSTVQGLGLVKKDWIAEAWDLGYSDGLV